MFIWSRRRLYPIIYRIHNLTLTIKNILITRHFIYIARLSESGYSARRLLKIIILIFILIETRITRNFILKRERYNYRV
jgi:hypothetical protein